MNGSDRFLKCARLAVNNVIRHGDTDIFPFPFENILLNQRKDHIVGLLKEYDDKFDDYLTHYPPENVNSLTPVGYVGFRWATQIDPIWNLHFLTSVLMLGEKIEAARISTVENVVFSYRYDPDRDTGDLFNRSIGWQEFMAASSHLSLEYPYVVACDVSEFYARLGHHRIENALRQIDEGSHVTTKIMSFLDNFSNTRSFGLPIGGPAARILAEITLNQIDRLLQYEGIRFTRFADDYHLFAKSQEDAYVKLLFLSEKLIENQGLSIQKSKTRFMSSAEFRSTNITDEDISRLALEESQPKSALLKFSFRFDPYSPNALEDYEKLKSEISRFDILGMLHDELSKSRVHTALTRKLIAAVRLLDTRAKGDALLSLFENQSVVYPIFSSVLLLADMVFEEIPADVQVNVVDKIRSMIDNDSFVLNLDTHLCFAVRVIARQKSAENQILLTGLYKKRTSPIVRRDIILVLARWGEWYWLSDLRNKFRTLSGSERRAFIVASFELKDEGKHWRDHVRDEFSPFERLVRDWAAEKVNKSGWSVPL